MEKLKFVQRRIYLTNTRTENDAEPNNLTAAIYQEIFGQMRKRKLLKD